MRMLLAEDDTLLSESLCAEFEHKGFAVDVADNGVDAKFMGSEVAYDVVVLDLGLPGESGLAVLRSWREGGNRVPVLILTARDAWHERVEGFRAGADDYLGKPFHIQELLARVQALIHRSHDMPGSRLRSGGLELDEERQRVKTPGGNWTSLTGTEFRLLRYLMLNPDKIHSKARLIEHIYHEDFDRDSNVIEVYIRRLRDIIGKQKIVTRRHQGYLFSRDQE